MKILLKNIFRRLGVGVVSFKRLVELQETEHMSEKFLKALANGVEMKSNSQAQLFQDIFVLLAFDFKREGYFVEFGGTNGKDLSNTYLLEKEYGWNGILAEPSSVWHKDLMRNRTCKLELDCVWHTTGETLKFNQADEGELSGVAEFVNEDGLAARRTKGMVTEVTSISLNDMLQKHDAPKFIDYLSVDTEGSELAILEAFDFEDYKVSIIHVEHNYIDSKREGLHSLLSRHGYQRRHQNFSKWDDWYYREDLINR